MSIEDIDGNVLDEVFCESCKSVIAYVNEGEEVPPVFCDRCVEEELRNKERLLAREKEKTK